MKNSLEGELPIRDIPRFIIAHVTPDRSVLVAIDGAAGSGKTTFAHWLAGCVRERMTPASLVHIDHFYRPSAERVNHQFPLAMVSDIDWKRLRDQVILPLRSGKTARFQRYDWPADCLKDWRTIDAGGVTIIDGVTATRNELSDYYDLRIWFSCPRDIRVSRMLGRGDTSAAEIEHWLPSEDQYIASHAPQRTVHLVVDSAPGMTTEDGNRWVVTRWLPPRGA